MTKTLKLRLQDLILKTLWTTTHFYLFYENTDIGSVKRTHVITEETRDIDHTIMQLKYHIKGQTRLKYLVKITKNAYYKSFF